MECCQARVSQVDSVRQITGIKHACNINTTRIQLHTHAKAVAHTEEYKPLVSTDTGVLTNNYTPFSGRYILLYLF